MSGRIIPIIGFSGMFTIGAALALLAVLLISSLLNIAYLLPIPVRAFFGKAADGTVYTEIKEAPPSCLLAMIVTSLACLVLFFYPGAFYELASMAAGVE